MEWLINPYKPLVIIPIMIILGVSVLAWFAIANIFIYVIIVFITSTWAFQFCKEFVWLNSSNAILKLKFDGNDFQIQTTQMKALQWLKVSPKQNSFISYWLVAINFKPIEPLPQYPLNLYKRIISLIFFTKSYPIFISNKNMEPELYRMLVRQLHQYNLKGVS